MRDARLEERLLVSALMNRLSTSAMVWRLVSVRRRKSTSPTRRPEHSDTRGISTAANATGTSPG